MSTTITAIEAQHAAGQRWRERLFRGATLAAALLVLLLLGGVALSLAVGAWPALSHFKLSFLTREIWNPVTDQYGHSRRSTARWLPPSSPCCWPSR